MTFKYNKEVSKLKVNFTEDMDSESCRKIKKILDGYILKFQPRTLYLDLSKVNFMDSSGIGLLMGRYNFSKMFNTKMYILNPNEKIKKIIEISNMEEVIEVVEEEYE